jgi:hypothetical protein
MSDMKQVILIKRGYCTLAHKVQDWDKEKAAKIEVINRVLEVFTSDGVLHICIADSEDDNLEREWRNIPIDQLYEWKVRH